MLNIVEEKGNQDWGGKIIKIVEEEKNKKEWGGGQWGKIKILPH